MKIQYDISSLNKIADKQEETETLYRTLLNTNPAGVIIITLKNEQILEINNSMLRILGFSREECIGRSLLDIGFYTSKKIHDRVMEFLIANKSIQDREFPFLVRSGELHYGIFSAEVIEFQNQACIFAVMFDITTNIDTKTSLESTTTRLEILFQAIPDMLVIVNYAGEILRTNSAVSTRLGYSEELLRTMHILDIHPYNRRAEVVAIIGQMLSEEITQCNIPLITATGEEIPVETRIVLTNWDDQNVILGISRDVTERVAIQLQQQELQKQLQHAQKMEGIGMLAGGIAHDFNNILFPITAYSEILQEELPDSSILKTYVKEIHSAAIRAKELVKQILTFNSEVSQGSQVVQPSLIIKETVKLIRKTLPKSIKIEYKIQPDCKMIMIDPTQLYQIGMNLMINAFHAMEVSGGILTIKLENMTSGEIKNFNKTRIPGSNINNSNNDRNQDSSNGVDKCSNYVLISVSDTGTGMDELTIEKIFNPYFTTKHKDKGTGLGLSVVHGIINLYKGKIFVESTPGKGSTFNILLPAIENQEEQIPIIEKSSSCKGRESILFVDDEEIIIKPLTKMLKALGYNITSFTSSIDALEHFTKNPDQFDLVITDLSIPNMSGIQLSEKILKLRPLMPVILCTGFSYNLTPEKVKQLGIKALLMKPVIKSELTHTIRQVLDSCN